jgi:hypothetical protein
MTLFCFGSISGFHLRRNTPAICFDAASVGIAPALVLVFLCVLAIFIRHAILCSLRFIYLRNMARLHCFSNVCHTCKSASTAAVLWLFTITTLLALTELPTVQAQPRDTVIVELNRPQVFSGRYMHWRNTRYRWTVIGRGNIGQVSGPQIVPDAVEVDARFVLTNLGVATLPRPTKLPLDANGAAGQMYCAVPAAGGAQTQQGACDIFFATNALLGTTKTLEQSFRLDTAARIRQFAFVPDADTLNPQSVYVATVRGAPAMDIPAQFAFVERFGEQSNALYGDNLTGGRPTTFQVFIERLSPELVVSEPLRRFDGSPAGERPVSDATQFTSIVREEVVNFGNIPVGSSAQLTRLLRNRGIEPLRIIGLRFPQTLSFPAPDISGTEPFPRVLERDGRTLQIDFRFTARTAGLQTDTVLVFVNDSTQALVSDQSGNPAYAFRFILRGTGVNGVLSGPPSFDFGKVRVGSGGTSFQATVVNSGSTPVVVERIVRPAPSSPFSETSSPALPATLLPMQQLGALSFSFAPRTAGTVVDSVVVQGINFPNYTIVLTGTGAASSAMVFNSATPGVPSDTIDFGSVIPGGTAVRSLTVQNTGNITLAANFFTDFSPTGNPGDIVEFTLPVLSGTVDNSRNFAIVYTAPTNALPGRREVVLNVTVRESENSITQNFNDPVLQRRFILRARVGAVLAADSIATAGRGSTNERIFYDSVYVGAQRTVSVTMRNQARQPITLVASQSQRIIPQPRSENAFLITDSLRRQTFAPNDADVVGLAYRPQRRGHDSATFEVTYRTADNRQETSSLALSGVGVEQYLSLHDAFPDAGARSLVTILPRTATRQFDTVNLGDVRLGSSRTATVVFRNEGNIPFIAESRSVTAVAPTNMLTNELRLLAGFSESAPNRALAPSRLDSALRVQFTPLQQREYVLRYTITSNLRSRIPSAPDTALQKIIFIRGRGVEPAIDVAPMTLLYENVPITFACANVQEQTLRISNPGTAILENISLELPRPVGNTIFSFAPGQSTNFSLPPGTERLVRIRFTAPADTRQSLFTDTLTIRSNATAPRNELKVVLRASTTPTPRASVAVARFRARPGVRLAVPVEVSSTNATNPLTRIQTAELRLSYNTTLLQYVGAETIGTAAAGARIQDIQSTSGVMVNIQGMNETSPLQRRLITLLFDTFIGTQPATELALSNIRLGTDACQEVVEIVGITNGSFLPDSVCNLVQKSRAAGSSNNVFALSLSSEILASSAPLSFEVAFPTHIHIALYNTRGELLGILANGYYEAGVYETRLPHESLGAGLFFCRMQAGESFSTVRKVILLR